MNELHFEVGGTSYIGKVAGFQVLFYITRSEQSLYEIDMVRYLIDFFVRWFVAKTASWAGRLKHQSKNLILEWKHIISFLILLTPALFLLIAIMSSVIDVFQCFFVDPKYHKQPHTHTHTNKQAQI